ncbi:MAG: signal recognition particle protein [Solirubrobacterales bacterium]
MFDQLSERLRTALDPLGKKGRITDEDVDRAMREVRLALLEADVNFKVVKQFTEGERQRCLETEVTASVDPGQQVIKVVNDELAGLMGGTGRELAMADEGLTVILLAGLQGSGKTTTAAKLASMLVGEGLKVGVAACDLQRPAAVEQLANVGGRAGATVITRPGASDPVAVATEARQEALDSGLDVLIVDTAGRLDVDQELMEELSAIRKAVRPHDVLLVVDAMTGQAAVEVAQAFSDSVGVDGVVLTKLDGDARGGAALSVRAVTGSPILFASTGEGLEAFDRFHPDRMAGRILGMGDILSLVEKAEREVDRDQAEELQRKMASDGLTLEDFLTQMRQVRKMGPLGSLLGMMPGLGQMKQLKEADLDERELDRVEAIILSMTPEERLNPELVKGSRRRRIATGSGTSIQQVNNLVKQFGQMRRLMKQVASGGMPDPEALAKAVGKPARPRVRRR